MSVYKKISSFTFWFFSFLVFRPSNGFVIGFWLFLATKLPKYYVIVYLLFLLSKARQAKTEHMEMKISQPIFGILEALTKNEVTKICNEPGTSHRRMEMIEIRNDIQIS